MCKSESVGRCGRNVLVCEELGSEELGSDEFGQTWTTKLFGYERPPVEKRGKQRKLKAVEVFIVVYIPARVVFLIGN